MKKIQDKDPMMSTYKLTPENQEEYKNQQDIKESNEKLKTKLLEQLINIEEAESKNTKLTAYQKKQKLQLIESLEWLKKEEAEAEAQAKVKKDTNTFDQYDENYEGGDEHTDEESNYDSQENTITPEILTYFYDQLESMNPVGCMH